MIAQDNGKRKRLVQPTLEEIYKKQRLGSGKATNSSSMAELTDRRDTTTGSINREHSVQPHASYQGETLEYDICDSTDEYSSSVTDKGLEEPVQLGVSFDILNRAPDCCGPMPTLKPQPGHTILFRPYVCAEKPPRPYPDTYRDSWDRNHVRMPCSKESLYPDKTTEKKLLSRWELIRSSLLRQMTSSYDLQEAVLGYNAHYAKRWNFRTLHLYLLEKITADEHREFFSSTLPGIIQLALQLPILCTRALPLLKRQQEHTITMTQQQAASLLANAFLCTFPRRNGVKYPDHEFGNYPDINFNRLFQGDNQESPKKIEKLRCIFHYFKRVTERRTLPRAQSRLKDKLSDLMKCPSGIGYLGRIVIKNSVAINHQLYQLLGLRIFYSDTRKFPSPNINIVSCCCSSSLCHLRVSSDGTIEDDATGFLQVDFANEFVGGGVLGEGCVQEEIRFAICPELILSRLFTERLEENECLIITGAERFSNYSGYADTFEWAGNHDDQTPRDSWGRLHTEVVAINAKPYARYSEQFLPPNLKRELEKAFCGFLWRGIEPKSASAVATGNWGCGAFKGDRQLKSLIQIMAASASSRDVIYFTFNDMAFAKELHETHSLLTDKNVTVGKLWQILNDFRKDLSSQSSNPCGIFSYIHKLLETDDDPGMIQL